MKRNEEKILNMLRNDSRTTSLEISKRAKIGHGTVSKAIKKLDNNIIVKHYSKIDFSKINFNIRMFFFVNSKSLPESITQSPNINSIVRLGNNSRYFIDAYFQKLKDVENFEEVIDGLGIRKFHVLKELKSEEAMK